MGQFTLWEFLTWLANNEGSFETFDEVLIIKIKCFGIDFHCAFEVPEGTSDDDLLHKYIWQAYTSLNRQIEALKALKRAAESLEDVFRVDIRTTDGKTHLLKV